MAAQGMEEAAKQLALVQKEEEMRNTLESQGVALGGIGGEKPKKGEDAAHRHTTKGPAPVMGGVKVAGT